MSSSGGRPPRRMLPSVTDVVNELARSVQADPAVLFKVSRQVVAEELGRVKQGFESASIEILAKRARRLLDPATAGEAPPPPPPVQPNLFNAPEPPPPVPEPSRPPVAATSPAASATPPPPASSEEPFAASSEMDLGWEKDFPIQADDAPFRSAILPIPRSRMPAGIAPPDATAPEAAPAVAPPAAPAAPVPSVALPEPAPPAAEFELAEEPEREKAAPPAPPAALEAPNPEAAALPSPSALKPDSASFLRSPAPAVPSAPPPMRSDERPAFVRSDTRPAFEPPPSPDARQPIRPPEEAGRRAPGRISTREWKALGDIGVAATERLADPAPRAASVREASPAAPAPPLKPPSSRGRLIAALAALLIAAGLAYFFRDVLFGRPATKPENPVAAQPPRPTPAPPTPVPATPTPAPVAAVTRPGPASKAATKMETKVETRATAAPAAAPVAARPLASASGWSKGSLIVSKEWAGKAAIWVIHFSSHKDRVGAEKEAARLAAALGKTGHAIEVDLGEKGIWYRVLIGDFTTQDDARAYHTELEVKNTPNLGFVYQLRGE